MSSNVKIVVNYQMLQFGHLLGESQQAKSLSFSLYLKVRRLLSMLRTMSTNMHVDTVNCIMNTSQLQGPKVGTI